MRPPMNISIQYAKRFASSFRFLFLLIATVSFFGHGLAEAQTQTNSKDAPSLITGWEQEIINLTDQIDEIGAPIPMATEQVRQLIRLLIQRGEAWRMVGNLDNAAADFQKALSKTEEETTPNLLPALKITTMISLGYIHTLQNDFKSAEPLLRSAFEKCHSHADISPVLFAASANRLGHLLARTRRQSKALDLYIEGLTILKSEDPALEAALHRNIAALIPDVKTAFTHLASALECTNRVPAIFERTTLLIDIATEAENRDPGPAGDAFRYHALQQATILAETIDEAFDTTPSPQSEDQSTVSIHQKTFTSRPYRLLSLCYGKMGALYESRNRVNEAISLTEQAIAEAGAIQNHALLKQWEWQLGRLLKAKNENLKAIAAYQRALFHLDAIRHDAATIDDQENCPPLQNNPFAIYTELADLLLNQSGKTTDETKRQQYLRAARTAMERGKQSELRDYFKDPCIRSKTKEIKALASGTAVIYPLVLPDRLEVLSEIEGILHRHTMFVSKSNVEQTITQLVNNIRNNLFYQSLSQTVFEWLISPLIPQLQSNRVETLVFVPDGVFRMLPLSALWDGEAFLSESYAVVTEPSLTLFDPKPLPRSGMTALMAGMSEPGPVVMALPDPLWNTLSRIDPNEKNRWIRGITIKSAARETALPQTDDRALRMTISEGTSKSEDKKNEQPLKRDEQAVQIREILKLPGVTQEMENITATLDGDMMIDDQFLLSNFSHSLEQKDYDIIHIASHGFFGGSAEENFIMTYDKILDMNHMESFIRPKQFAAKPVELITLSACQTAEGDDRSPLGLSGVALKSGARSVMGSLWPVSDSATQILLSHFYSFLKNEKITKAQALQLAQRELIKDEMYQHPFHWAPFILIGNWL